MKLMIYAMNYAPEIAGVGRVNGEIAEYFAAQGDDVTVVTTPPHYPGWVALEGYRHDRYRTETLNGVKVVRCPLWLRQPMGGIWRLIAPLTFAISSGPCAMWRILVDRPDVVLCIEPTLLAAPAAQLAAAIVGAKSALHVQDLEVDASFAVGHLSARGWLKRAAFAFERLALRGFDGVVTISARMAGRLAEKGVPQDRMEIVRNWVDLDRIRPLPGPSPYRAELKISDAEKVVLYSGNIGPKQGLDAVVEAAERLAARRDIVFVIAGEGPAKAALQARAAALPNVRFLPFQPYARLSEFLGLADLHVLPQSAEVADLVLPSKLGGMLASGKPLVVTATPDTELAEFLDGGAYLTPPGDAAALADAVAAALTRADPAPARAHRLALSRRLGRTQGLAAFAALFSDLAARPGRGAPAARPRRPVFAPDAP